MKQVIGVRKDLDMSTGKTAAQVSHASLWAYQDASKERQALWQDGDERTIVVQLEDADHLTEKYYKAVDLQVPRSVLRDKGFTEVEPETPTCVGVGPAEDEAVDNVMGDLPTL